MEFENLVECLCEYAEGVILYAVASGNGPENDAMTDVLGCLEQLFECVTLVKECVPSTIGNNCEELIESVAAMMRYLEAELDGRVRISSFGRPAIVIEEEQLIFFVDNCFKVDDMALILGCSKRTVERRLSMYQLSTRHFTAITDIELDELVKQQCSVYPRCGEKLINGRLHAEGIRVQRHRVRESIRRVDPSGVQSRLRRVLHRRRYEVDSPNALWHLDGHHKLIRWRIVIHGGIDGYSRLIMYLQASPNNRAETTLAGFLKAVDEFGLPSRVRTDKGGENILVAQYMLAHPERGPGRRSIITGKSTHNQRIERLWRDVFSGCLCFFNFFFYFLEDTGLLDVDDVLDLYTLHYVFLPLIQKQLDLFKQAWARHPLRTERNRSPLQLWMLGLHAMIVQDQQHPAVSGTTLDWDDFGVDWDGPVPRSVVNEESAVVVEDIDDVLSADQKANLDAQLHTLNPTSSMNEGLLVNQFSTAKTFIHCVNNEIEE